MTAAGRDLEVVAVAIDVIERDAPLVPVNDQRGTLGGRVRQGVLRVRTMAGIEGHCLVGVQGGNADDEIRLIVEQIKPRVLGRLASEREAVWAQRRELDASPALAHSAMSPVDVALWDIVGKAAGLPVHALLGTMRNEIPVYATYPPRSADPAAYREEGLELRGDGYPAYKIHPGRLATDGVITMVARVRDAVGDGMALMLDPNAGYTLDQALTIGAALDEQRFAWLEDPLPWQDLDAIEQLTRALRTPVAIADAPPFLLKQAVATLRRDAAKLIRGTSRKMGITGLRQLCAMLAAFGMNCEIGMGGNQLLNAANLHVMLSISNCDYYEYWMPLGMHEWGVTQALTPDSRGTMMAPDIAGLGLELDEDWIAAHRVAVAS